MKPPAPVTQIRSFSFQYGSKGNLAKFDDAWYSADTVLAIVEEKFHTTKRKAKQQGF